MNIKLCHPEGSELIREWDPSTPHAPSLREDTCSAQDNLLFSPTINANSRHFQ
jgi:hypothetical protein